MSLEPLSNFRNSILFNLLFLSISILLCFLFIILSEFKNNFTKLLCVIKLYVIKKVINDGINQVGADISDTNYETLTLPLANDKKLNLDQEIQKYLLIDE